MAIKRRNLVFSLGAVVALPGCLRTTVEADHGTNDPDLIRHYAARDDRGVRIPAVNTDWVEAKYLRKEIPNTLRVKAGDILVETAANQLYFGLDDDTLIRYGVTLGADAFIWSGEGYVQRIRAWPTWTPTARMIREDPRLTRYSGGMPGGLKNPLGARALYIFEGERDTLYRIHGTNATWLIGQNFSSGCIRMFNQDVIELAELARPDAKIRVR